MECPFCNRDPYHYVDIGVGMEPVAVVCCDPGIAYFAREKSETVTLDGDDFEAIGNKMSAMQDGLKAAEEWLSGWASAEPYLSRIQAALASTGRR